MGRIRQFVKDTRENIGAVKWLLSKSDTYKKVRGVTDDIGVARRLIYREFR